MEQYSFNWFFFSVYDKIIKNLILLTYVGVNGVVLTNTSVRLDLLSINLTFYTGISRQPIFPFGYI